MSETKEDFGRADWMNELWSADRDLALADELVRRGLLSPLQLETALQEQQSTSPSPRLEDIILAHKWVERATLEGARKGLEAGEFSKLATSRTHVPEEVIQASGDPAKHVAEYILVSSIGSGGGGDVWKAWDKTIGRWVALKIPRNVTASKIALERFQREALAAGRLNHPGIVPVYAVGEAQGRPFIVMQLIEGETLDQVRLPLRQALETVRAAALALDHAHSQGVVHRDIKPGNLMVDRRGATWIVDFGIAHLAGSDSRLTATGVVLGTAAYMSPEQAQGISPPRESAIDVYGLGATLYDLTTGHPPFAGEAFAEIVNKVVRDEPIRPRKLHSRLPEDVETVILKAMEKDPTRRYASAKELADDLGRILADEPILARPPSAGYRVRKFLRKNRLATVLATAAAAAIVVAAASAIRSAERSKKLEVVAHEKEQERVRYDAERRSALALLRETARVSLDAALELRREGANDRMRKFLEPLQTAYQQAVVRAPDLAEVDYRMGRMYRAMMDDVKALEYQNRALSKDPDYAPALYERAVLLAKKFAGNLKKAAGESIPDRTADEYTLALRTITGDCTRLERVLSKREGGTLGITDANLSAARGILAYYQERLTEAARLLTEAVEKDPDMEMAWDALARTAVQQPGVPGETARAQGIALYTKGLARDRGYVPLLMGRGSLHMSIVYDKIERGDDPTGPLEAAERDFSDALRLNPGDPEAWLKMADLQSNQAFRATTHGRDPVSLYDAAEQKFTRAIELDPAMIQAWRGRGILRTYRARYLAERGENSETVWNGAVEDMSRFAALVETAEPWRLADALMRRATALSERALCKKDGDADLLQAEQDFERALKLDGSQARIWSRRGAARLKHAEAQIARGEDPLVTLAKAESDLSTAIQKQASLAEAWTRRGMLRSRRAQYLAGKANDGSPDIGAAATDLTRAIELNKEALDAWTERGSLRLWQAGRLLARADYDRAAADYSQAIAINPTLAGSLEKKLGAIRERLGKD